MRHLLQVLLLPSLLPIILQTTAAPVTSTSTTDITPSQLLAIAPSSSTCSNTPFIGECSTASQAAVQITQSFTTYNITSKAEQAALVALMAFESGEFKYNRNHWPGVPGQGTRNMQSPAFNAKYALAVPQVKCKLSTMSGDGSNPGTVLDVLLSNEEWDYGSAAWFLTTQCSQEVRQQLQTGSEEGWMQYIESCVGASVTDGRRGYWMKAGGVLAV